MIILIGEILVAVIALLWLNFHFKNIENKLDIVINMLSKKKK